MAAARVWHADRRLRVTLALCGAMLLGLLGWRLWAVPADEAPAPASDDGVSILLGLTQQALAEHRLLAPAGANAYEFALSVLQLQAGNRAARQTLQAHFEAACEEVERRINGNELDEAQRELRLLREFDPNNYTVLLLDGKLGAKRALMVREDEARAAILQARQAGGS